MIHARRRFCQLTLVAILLSLIIASSVSASAHGAIDAWLSTIRRSREAPSWVATTLSGGRTTERTVYNAPASEQVDRLPGSNIAGSSLIVVNGQTWLCAQDQNCNAQSSFGTTALHSISMLDTLARAKPQRFQCHRQKCVFHLVYNAKFPIAGKHGVGVMTSYRGKLDSASFQPREGNRKSVAYEFRCYDRAPDVVPPDGAGRAKVSTGKCLP
jgi:hypothetical protein